MTLFQIQRTLFYASLPLFLLLLSACSNLQSAGTQVQEQQEEVIGDEVECEIQCGSSEVPIYGSGGNCPLECVFVHNEVDVLCGDTGGSIDDYTSCGYHCGQNIDSPVAICAEPPSNTCNCGPTANFIEGQGCVEDTACAEQQSQCDVEVTFKRFGNIWANHPTQPRVDYIFESATYELVANLGLREINEFQTMTQVELSWDEICPLTNFSYDIENQNYIDFSDSCVAGDCENSEYERNDTLWPDNNLGLDIVTVHQDGGPCNDTILNETHTLSVSQESRNRLAASSPEVSGELNVCFYDLEINFVSEDEQLCRDSFGSWVPDSCGFPCGVAPDAGCDETAEATCQCPFGADFINGEGCVQSNVCQDEFVLDCTNSGGTYDSADESYEYVCGSREFRGSSNQLNLSCDCGPTANFVEGQGCVEDTACLNSSNDIPNACFVNSPGWGVSCNTHDDCGEGIDCIDTGAPIFQDDLNGEGLLNCNTQYMCQNSRPIDFDLSREDNCEQGLMTRYWSSELLVHECVENYRSALCQVTGGVSVFSTDPINYICGEEAGPGPITTGTTCDCGPTANFIEGQGCVEDETCNVGNALCDITDDAREGSPCLLMEDCGPQVEGSEDNLICFISNGEMHQQDNDGVFINCGSSIGVCLSEFAYDWEQYWETSCLSDEGTLDIAVQNETLFGDERAVASMCDASPRQLDVGWCRITGGTFINEDTCPYLCGESVDCDILEPYSCDCGPTANFIEGQGCVEDVTCGN